MRDLITQKRITQTKKEGSKKEHKEKGNDSSLRKPKFAKKKPR